MVTLHIHKPANQLTSWSPYASQEDLFVRSEMVCSYLRGTASLPKGVSLDVFSGEFSFSLLSPRNYSWKKGDPVYLFTYQSESLDASDPGTLVWALHIVESQQVPVFLLPFPGGRLEETDYKPGIYQNVEHLETLLPSMVKQGPVCILSHGKSFYEILLLLIRDRSRKTPLIPEDTSIISLFGGDALACSDEVIPDRKELKEMMHDLADRISVIALTNDRRIPAAQILRSWMDNEGSVLAEVDLVKPAFQAREGIFPPDPLPFADLENGDASVMQKTRYDMQLRMEVSQMICRLLTEHTKKQH